MRRLTRSIFPAALLALTVMPTLLLSACSHTPPASSGLQVQNLPTPPAFDQAIAVPLYQYPMSAPGVYNPFWQKVVEAQQLTGLVKVAVVNPDSGPYVNGAPEPNYITAIAYLKQNAVPVYGYVDSDYGKRSIADAKTDVDRWFTAYGVTDIFFDRVETDCNKTNQIDFYVQLSDYVRSKGPGRKVILNPGTIASNSECLMNYSDILGNFENVPSAYAAFTPPDWTTKYRPERFWHMIHTLNSEAEQNQALNTSRSKWAGHVFATSDVLDNPYDSLSLYWDNYVDQVAALTP